MTIKTGIFITVLGMLMACSSGGNRGGYCPSDAGAEVSCTPPTSSGPTPILGPCTKGGWCLQWKTERGKYPTTIYGTSANNVWAVGLKGLALKWNGNAWTQEKINSIDSDFRDVWTTGSDNVWILSASGYDSSKYKTKIFQWNGQEWILHEVSSANALYAIWGVDAENIWAVGDKGTIVNWNGKTWKSQVSGTSKSLYSLWGTDVDNIWAVGEQGTILKWDGNNWLNQRSSTSNSFSKIWGFNAKNIWAIGSSIVSNWNGDDWFADPEHNAKIKASCRSIGGASPNNLWAVCNYSEPDKRTGKTITIGVTYLYNGKTWAYPEIITTNTGEEIIENGTVFNSTYGLSDVWAADDNHAWLVSEAGILFKGQ